MIGGAYEDRSERIAGAGHLLEVGLGAFAGAMLGGLAAPAAIMPLAACGAFFALGLRVVLRFHPDARAGQSGFRTTRRKVGE